MCSQALANGAEVCNMLTFPVFLALFGIVMKSFRDQEVVGSNPITPTFTKPKSERFLKRTFQWLEVRQNPKELR